MLARSKVYWLGMDADIESYIAACEACKIVNFKPIPDQLPWPATAYPFERVHIDFCTFQGVTFLIMVDAFSKWIHVVEMNTCTAKAFTLESFKIFSIWGFPHILVSDNGPPFGSSQGLMYQVKHKRPQVPSLPPRE